MSIAGQFAPVFSAVVVPNAGDPGVPLLLILMLVAGAALGLVVVVLRALHLGSGVQGLERQPGDLLEFVED